MEDVTYTCTYKPHKPKDCKLTGTWEMLLTGPDGEVKDYRAGKNVITSMGISFLGGFLNSAATAATTFTTRYIGIGTDSTGEQTSNVALGAELVRQSGTVTFSAPNIYQVVTTFAAGTGTGTIVEYGLFNSSTGGVLFSRDTEAAIGKGASDTLTVTTRITLA